MGVKQWKVLFFLLLFITFKISEAAPKILIKRYEHWNHPVLSVFKKYGITIYKVSYSVDGTCPTFYATFTQNPDLKALTANHFYTIYSEILRANSYFSYAIVDEKNNVKINVGWKDKNQKTMVVEINKMPAISLCLGNSHAHVDDYVDYDPFIVDEQMKKEIMNSPYKEQFRRGDGKKFIVYLYAANEQIKSEQNYSCDGAKEKSVVKIGNYYIYLYDVNSNSFFPGRIPIFNDSYKTKMNVRGSDFFVLSSDNNNQSDVLLISQFGDCTGDDYEAYGFAENQLFLKKYFFIGKEKHDQFYGKIEKSKKNGKLLAHGQYEGTGSQDLYLFLSKTSGVVMLQPAIKEECDKKC